MRVTLARAESLIIAALDRVFPPAWRGAVVGTVDADAITFRHLLTYSERAFGHTGFTGTSLWIDPARELVVACCTHRVYYGRNPAGILEFRVALHRAIVEAVDA